MENNEGVRKMSTGMEQKECPEKRGEMLGRSMEEKEGVRKMSSDMEQKEWSERNTEEEEAMRDMSKKKGLEREECLGQSARL